MIIKKHDPERLNALAELGCLICAKPTQIHHLRRNPLTGKHYGMGQRAPDTFTIPLCMEHHQFGAEAFHAGPATFEERFGTEKELWEQANRLIHFDAQ